SGGGVSSHKRCCDLQLARAGIFRGRVGEWLKPADCKSAAPCGLRRFESSPVHQFSVRDLAGVMDAKRSPAQWFAVTAGQSQDAMFESGPNRGKQAAKEKCAAKSGLMCLGDCGMEQVRPG